jgi:hypothetical protein
MDENIYSNLEDTITDNDVLIDEIEERAIKVWTDKQRAIAGVVFMKDGSFVEGVQLPKDSKAKVAEAKKKAVEKEKAKASTGGYSDALITDLEKMLTGFAQAELAKHPALAGMALALALFGSDKSPLRVLPQGLATKEYNLGKELKAIDFAPKGDLPATLDEMFDTFNSPAKLAKLVGVLAANAMPRLTAKHGLFKHMPMEVEKLWRPDAAFFERISSAQMMDALKEAKAPLPKGGLKKAEMVAWCAKHIPPTKWLPKQLRTA